MATTSLDEAKSGQLSVTTRTANLLDKLKPQLALALPKHLNADRMSRVALTCMRQNPKLMECDPTSIAGAIVTLAQLGLEPGVLGQGYLVPYFDRRANKLICQAIPGWQGMVELINRAGLATVWTGAVYETDHFDYAFGDAPFVNHRPNDDRPDDARLMYVYACGRVNGAQHAVIEVWSVNKVRKHLATYNKVGERHYALADGGRNFEMYARKVPLLQVAKYMPKSIELRNALAVAQATDSGDVASINPEQFVTIVDGDTGEITTGMPGQSGGQPDEGQQSAAPAQPSGQAKDAPKARTYAQLASAINNAKNADEAGAVLDEGSSTLPPGQAKELVEVYRAKWST